MEKYYEKRIPNGWLFSLLLLALAGLAAGVFLDLRLASWIFDPQANWAQIFAAVSPVPAFWGLGAAGFLTIDIFRNGKYWILGWLIGFVFLAIGPVYMADSFMDELRFGWILAWISGLLISTLPALLYAFLMRKATVEDKIKCIVILLIVCVGSILIVQVTKRIWSRPRYILIQQYTDVPFSPWYKPARSIAEQFPNVMSANSDMFRSFPSGHSQSVACLFLWALIPIFTNKGSVHLSMIIASILSIATMASRMVLGAHFLSDVCAGFAITYLLFAICCWAFKLTRKNPDEDEYYDDEYEEDLE